MAVALAMTTSTSIFARDRDSRRPMQQDMNNKMDQGYVIKDQQMMSGYNAPARYDVKGSWDFFFTADFLYWQTRLDNLAYGVGIIDSTTPAGLDVTDQRVLNVDFGWHPGVRLGMGVNSDQDDWDFYVEWTHVVSHNNTSARPNEGGAILATQIFPDFFPEQAVVNDGDRAWNSYRNIYNTVDLEMGRTYYVGKNLTFRPNVGVRGAWFRQSYNTQYDNLFDLRGAGNTNLGTTRIRSEFNDWSLGPRFGIDTSWLIGQGFRLFGDTAYSICWTSVSSKKRQTNDGQLLNFDTIRLRNTKAFGNLKGNFDAALGFGWGSYFDNGNWHFDLALAYEFHLWLDHNFDMALTSVSQPYFNVDRGNLGLHGGTFRVRFDF